MNLSRVTNNLTMFNVKTSSICMRFLNMCQHLALVEIYHITEELSYFISAIPKYFTVRNKVFLVIPVSAALAALAAI